MENKESNIQIYINNFLLEFDNQDDMLMFIQNYLGTIEEPIKEFLTDDN